jgi:molybdenum cofactor guanylyltransferase
MIGVVLAGGRGRRMGGEKASRMLAGRPLASYPAAALAAVCARVALVGPGPSLPGVELWDDEPAEPRHPLTGIVHALERAGEPVLVCAADMPFVTPEVLRELAQAGEDAVAVAERVLQPVLGLYTPAALPTLRAASADAPLTRTIESLNPRRVEVPAAVARSVDTPEQLEAAEAELLRP